MLLWPDLLDWATFFAVTSLMLSLVVFLFFTNLTHQLNFHFFCTMAIISLDGSRYLNSEICYTRYRQLVLRLLLPFLIGIPPLSSSLSICIFSISLLNAVSCRICSDFNSIVVLLATWYCCSTSVTLGNIIRSSIGHARHIEPSAAICHILSTQLFNSLSH